MCYDLKASIVSYLLGLTAGITAIYTNQLILGWLILFYCQIQLAEAIIWYGIDYNSTTANKIGTVLLKYLLATHIIGVGIGIYYSTKSPRTVWPLALGIVMFFVGVIVYQCTTSPSTTYPGETGRLKWEFPLWWYNIGYIIFIALIWLFIPDIYSRLFMIITFSILWLMAQTSKSPGSVWCFMSAIAAPLIVAGNYLILTRSI